MPRVGYKEEIVQVPRVEYQENSVQRPLEQVIPMPRVEYKEEIVQVPRVEYQEKALHPVRSRIGAAHHRPGPHGEGVPPAGWPPL